jgi:hypothetical protein
VTAGFGSRHRLGNRPIVLGMAALLSSMLAGNRTAGAWPTGTSAPPAPPSSPAPSSSPAATAAPPARATLPPPAAPAPTPTSTSTSTAIPPPSSMGTPFPSTKPPPAVDAAGALERVRAAYEYGDIDEVVESARQVADGRLHPSPAQRAYALRYLGIGLFLTGRTEGAETAFFELLRLRPESRLDPQNTRPDAVAFFEQVRLRYAQPIREAARANNRKTFLWNFLPPAGQFQNGHPGRGITIAALEVISLGTAITTLALLKHWEKPGHLFPGHTDDARALKIVNYVSVTALAATALFGIIDGIAHYSDPADDPPAPTTARLGIAPGGFSLDF